MQPLLHILPNTMRQPSKSPFPVLRDRAIEPPSTRCPTRVLFWTVLEQEQPLITWLQTYAQCEELQRRLIEKFLPLPKKKAKSNPMADKSPIVEMNRSESLEFLTASCGPQHARTNENPSKD